MRKAMNTATGGGDFSRSPFTKAVIARPSARWSGVAFGWLARGVGAVQEAMPPASLSIRLGRLRRGKRRVRRGRLDDMLDQPGPVNGVASADGLEMHNAQLLAREIAIWHRELPRDASHRVPLLSEVGCLREHGPVGGTTRIDLIATFMRHQQHRGKEPRRILTRHGTGATELLPARTGTTKPRKSAGASWRLVMGLVWLRAVGKVRGVAVGVSSTVVVAVHESFSSGHRACSAQPLHTREAAAFRSRMLRPIRSASPARAAVKGRRRSGSQAHG